EGPCRLPKYEEAIQTALHSAIAQLGLPFDPAGISVREAVEFLTLRAEKRDGIGIGYPGPHHVFLPCGEDRGFVDSAHLFRRLVPLFHGVSLSDQNFKGEALEVLTRRGRSVLPSGELKGADGTSRQIDAAFGIGELLVIAECRVVARSIAV